MSRMYWWVLLCIFATLRQTNIAMENGFGLKMYFLLNIGIFQPAMLVYQRAVYFDGYHHHNHRKGTRRFCKEHFLLQPNFPWTVMFFHWDWSVWSWLFPLWNVWFWKILSDVEFLCITSDTWLVTYTRPRKGGVCDSALWIGCVFSLMGKQILLVDDHLLLMQRQNPMNRMPHMIQSIQTYPERAGTNATLVTLRPTRNACFWNTQRVEIVQKSAENFHLA